MKQIFAVAFLFCAAFFFSPQKAFSQPVESDFFRQEGIASWYGPEFDGRPTASGEIFNSALLTAAHPSLPFGTVVVVTNLHNGRSVQVRINDRGPFVHARIIDVSRAAAQELDMLITGTAPVVVESVDRITLPQGVRPGGTQAPAVTLAPVAPAQPAENWFSPPPEPQPQFLPPAQTAAPVPIPAQQAAPQQFAPPPQPVAQPQQQFVPPPQPVAQPQQQFVPPPQPVAQPQQQF
ncbi:MAG: septal ring lytic transglycosylase RlpA family protein, partial [Spirochaetes bacterium]|nr:septal ring lytic transglycosylase RlpA family protein [Spirochaetota bacterium]